MWYVGALLLSAYYNWSSRRFKTHHRHLKTMFLKIIIKAEILLEISNDCISRSDMYLLRILYILFLFY